MRWRAHRTYAASMKSSMDDRQSSVFHTAWPTLPRYYATHALRRIGSGKRNWHAMFNTWKFYLQITRSKHFASKQKKKWLNCFFVCRKSVLNFFQYRITSPSHVYGQNEFQLFNIDLNELHVFAVYIYKKFEQKTGFSVGLEIVCKKHLRYSIWFLVGNLNWIYFGITSAMWTRQTGTHDCLRRTDVEKKICCIPLALIHS